jgi:type VI secretion system protein
MAAMLEEALLERIRHLEKRPVLRGSKDLSLGIRSVINHLQKMLNTRQGSVPIADDYGMPDMTNFSGEDLAGAADELQLVIQQVIQKYEPRLKKVEVRFDPKPGETSILRFKLEGAMLADRDETIPITLETVVTAEGMVRMEK